MPDDQLEASLSELSTVVLGDQTIDDLLATVVGLARKTVGGADGVSVSLGELGRLTTSNATDEVVRELDEVQYRDNTGPCVDAFRHGRQVNLSLDGDERYPHFSAVASERFMTGVLSTPLAVEGRVLGALNLYSASVDRFPAADVEVATQFAQHASVLLANASSFDTATTTNEQLRQALLSRDVIGQAKGILMERLGCSADEAFDELRCTSQRENRKLTIVARDLIESRRRGGG